MHAHSVDAIESRIDSTRTPSPRSEVTLFGHLGVAVSGSDAPSDSSLLEDARSAWAFGLAAMGLAMVAPCGSYVTLLASLPLGIIAMNQAKRILEGGVKIDGATEAYARTARLTGLMAAIWSGIVLALIALIVVAYGGLIAVMLGAAATLPAPPPPPPPIP
jgi:hypothetical protein